MANPVRRYRCINASFKLLPAIFVHFYMKKFYTFITLWLCSMGLSMGQTLPYVSQPTYQAGEHLTYKLQYGILSVATGTLKVEKSKLRSSNLNAFHLSALGQTSALFSVYTVRNKDDSYMASNTYLPYLYIEDIHEGSYTREEYATFDQRKKKVSGKKGTFTSPTAQFFDLLSAYYFS